MRGVFFFLTAVAVTVPAAAQTPADHVAMGLKAQEAMKPEEALRHFEAALADSLHRGDRTPSYLR